VTRAPGLVAQQAVRYVARLDSWLATLLAAQLAAKLHAAWRRTVVGAALDAAVMRSWMHSWIQSRMRLQAVFDCSVSVSDDVGYSLRLQRLTAVFGCSSSCSAGCGCICQHGARDSQVCRTILVFVTTAVPMTRRGVGGSLSLCFSFCEMRLQRLTALLATQLGTGSGGRRWRSSFSFLAQAIRLGLPTSYAVNQHNFTKLVGTYFAPLHVKIKTPQIT